MTTKSPNRVLIVIVAVLVALLAALIGMFIWRERSGQKDDKAYTEENLRLRFPGYFRNAEEQKKFEAEYVAAFENPRPVNKSVNSKRPCVFQCFNQTQPQRKRRSSSSVFHGCCESSVTPCSGCTCAQEDGIYTAVVVRVGVTEPDDIDDVEIDFFRLDGCCRCVNT